MKTMDDTLQNYVSNTAQKNEDILNGKLHFLCSESQQET